MASPSQIFLFFYLACESLTIYLKLFNILLGKILAGI